MARIYRMSLLVRLELDFKVALVALGALGALGALVALGALNPLCKSVNE